MEQKQPRSRHNQIPGSPNPVDNVGSIAAASAPSTRGNLRLRRTPLPLSPSSGTLYAAHDDSRLATLLAFISTPRELPDRQAGSREGIWWLPKDTTSDYLVLQPRRDRSALLLSLYDVNARENKQAVLLGPPRPTDFSGANSFRSAGFTGSHRAHQVRPPRHAGSVDTLHFSFR